MKHKISLLTISLFVISLCNSCYPLNTLLSPWSVIDKDWLPTHFDDSINTHLSQRIRLDGYYMKPGDTLFAESIISRCGEYNIGIKYGVFNRNLLFFEDGTTSSFIFKDNTFIEQTNIDMQQSIFYEDALWGYGGRYIINQDTIKVFTVWTSCKPLGYELWEDTYQIIDSCTLKHIEFRSRMRGRLDEEYKRNEIYKFYEAYNFPKSDDIYIKSKKYFWKNKEDWKAYKQQMKQKRK